MNIALALVFAYLIGSIPSAFLAGKYTKGIDLRKHGSGNLGATNVYRVLGTQMAALVWLADTAKGFASVRLLPLVFGVPSDTVWPLILGMVAIVGHARPLFLGRGGGKGVATATGVFLALAWLPTLIAIATWGIVLWRSGYVSLASLAASVALCVGLFAVYSAASARFLFALGVTIFVFWSHRQNIARLRRGEEHRFRGPPATPLSSGGVSGGGHG